ncbi:hypothetical protein CIB95_13705 [Lottiidibacillus patelloidae]|uniref:histidine kinase n=1 Tax=Lottiidibacillus patelloidae TaxID=2670334 RepID=A0A263BR13_9BACI|nr:ATP-binding protein [Lottiidibacillus patelloidae]OZM56155.1 hypothetical protein CIB95_13705 [Lottiidibacillus patelloidae]
MLKPMKKDASDDIVSLSHLPLGAHVLYTYTDANKYIENAVAFICDGLKLMQHVVFIDSSSHIKMVKEHLINKGFESKIRNVLFAENKDFYYSKEGFVTEHIQSNFFSVTEPLLDKKVTLRTWGNTIWNDEKSLLEKLKHYESACNEFINLQKTLTVCSYNGLKLPASIHIELEKLHSYVMTDDDITNSKTYNQQNTSSQIHSKMLETLNKKLISSLRQTQNEYKFISDYSLNLITKVSKDGRLSFISNTSFILLGFSPIELLGKKVKEFIHPEDYKTLKEMDPWMQEHLLHLNYRVKKKDGNYLWMRAAINVVRNSITNEAEEIIFSAVDISKEKSLTESLQESELKLETNKKILQDLLDQIPEAIFIGNNGRMKYLNPVAANLLEADASELIGKKSVDYVHPDYVDVVDKRIKKVQREGKSIDFLDQKIITAKGNVVDVEAKTIPFEYNGTPSSLTVVRNISQRLLNQELALKSEKLTVAGQLAAGIAHEIRNPLTSIKGFLQLLKAGTIDIANYYNIMANEVTRIDTISSELLVLGKPISTTYKLENIFTLVSEVKVLLETQAIMKGINIELDIPETVAATIKCNATQMKQVFINILKNAIEAMNENGNIYVKGHIKANKAIIKITDEGPGIPQNIIKKLGEPFFTTKETGTGLGLMICYNIIEHHKGTISVESNPNKGSTFTITLPLKENCDE